MEHESRSAERVSIMTEIQIDVRGDELTVTTLDLGLGGLSVWAPYASPGGPVKVRLPLEDNLPPLELAARIAREYQSDGGSVWGIAFDPLDPRDRARLESFLLR